jgi:hypothetical protein
MRTNGARIQQILMSREGGHRANIFKRPSLESIFKGQTNAHLCKVKPQASLFSSNRRNQAHHQKMINFLSYSNKIQTGGNYLMSQSKNDSVDAESRGGKDYQSRKIQEGNNKTSSILKDRMIKSMGSVNFSGTQDFSRQRNAKSKSNATQN